MKQILGKIIALICLTTYIFATVSIKVPNIAIYKGDIATFTLEAQGKGDVEFPNITDVNGYTILGVSKSSSTSIINGKYSKTIARTYSFKPTKDVVIPPFTIKIDGTNYTTSSKKISVIKPQPSKQGDNFVVKLKVDKSNLKVGESTKLTLIFKHKINASADKINVEEPKIENFWVKKIEGVKKYSQGDYIVQELSYLIFAQKSGNFTINPIEVDIGKVQRSQYSGGFFNDPFFDSMTNNIKWQKIYSNSLNLKVDNLPNGVELYGDFSINATVDKTTVYANKPANLTITVEGIGNLDDIKKFDLDLDDAVVYADNPKINTQLVNNQYKGTFSQKIAIIANKDFTIPSISLEFFDKNSNKLKTIQTKPIKIKVLGTSVSNAQPLIQTQQPTTKEKVLVKEKIVYKNGVNGYLYFIVGLISGIILVYIFQKLIQNRSSQKENPFVKQIQKAKTDKELFDLLLPYAKTNQIVDEILQQLEQNLYKNGTYKIDKQKLYDIFWKI